MKTLTLPPNAPVFKTNPSERQRYKMQTQRLGEKKYFVRANLDDIEQYIAWGKFDHEQANLLRYGDQETLQRYLDVRHSLPELYTPQSHNGLGYSTSGSYVDVGRYLSGEPECMVSFNQLNPVKFIDVVVNIGRPLSTSDYTIMRHFGLVLDTIDRLESAGYRCRVIMAKTSVSARKPEINAFTLIAKDYQHPVNLAQMVALFINNDLINRFNDAQYEWFGLSWSIDMFKSFEYTQTDDRIYLPSIYYLNRKLQVTAGTSFDWSEKDLSWFLKLSKLEHLL